MSVTKVCTTSCAAGVALGTRTCKVRYTHVKLSALLAPVAIAFWAHVLIIYITMQDCQGLLRNPGCAAWVMLRSHWCTHCLHCALYWPAHGLMHHVITRPHRHFCGEKDGCNTNTATPKQKRAYLDYITPTKIPLPFSNPPNFTTLYLYNRFNFYNRKSTL